MAHLPTTPEEGVNSAWLGGVEFFRGRGRVTPSYRVAR